MRRGAGVMLKRPTDLARADELNEAEPVEDAKVIGDVAQRLVERVRELARARLAAQAQSFKDALSRWVRERLGEFRVKRPIARAPVPERDIDQLNLAERHTAPA
jgi:hypothetical protein